MDKLTNVMFLYIITFGLVTTIMIICTLSTLSLQYLKIVVLLVSTAAMITIHYTVYYNNYIPLVTSLQNNHYLHWSLRHLSVTITTIITSYNIISYKLSSPIIQNSHHPLYFFIILIFTTDTNIFTYSIVHRSFHNQTSSIK